jgi:hypothetical protein
MAWKPVSIFKRPSSKKGQYSYYVKLWDETHCRNTWHRSAASIALELRLDLKTLLPSSRTGAFLIGEERRRRGGVSTREASILLANYYAGFWNWKSSIYIQGKHAVASG